MKKLVIVLFVLVFLVGCYEEPKKTSQGWCLQYAIEEYNKDYEGYEIFSYSIEEMELYTEEKGKAFIITIANDSGDVYKYLTYILSKEMMKSSRYYRNYYAESEIVDFDIEKIPRKK